MTKRPFDPTDSADFSLDDETGRLYWKDKAVQTETVIVLSARQGFWASVATSAAIFAALATVGSCVADVKQAFFPTNNDKSSKSEDATVNTSANSSQEAAEPKTKTGSTQSSTTGKEPAPTHR